MENTTDERGCERVTMKDVPKKVVVHRFYFIKFSPYHDSDAERTIQATERRLENLNQDYLDLHKQCLQKWKDVNALDRRCLRLSRCMNRKTLVINNLSEELRDQRLSKAAKGHENNPFGLQVKMLHRVNNLATERKMLKEINSTCKCQEQVDSSEIHRLDQIRCTYEKLTRYSSNKGRDKKIFKEIEQLEKAREKAETNAVLQGKDFRPLHSMKVVKLVEKISEELKRENLETTPEMKLIEKERESVGKALAPLRDQLGDLCWRMDEASKNIRALRTKQEETNEAYNQHLSVLSNARELARKKDMAALQELSDRQVGRFMSLWTKSKSFRNEYKKNVQRSLDSRGLSGDGRRRNPGEESILS